MRRPDHVTRSGQIFFNSPRKKFSTSRASSSERAWAAISSPWRTSMRSNDFLQLGDRMRRHAQPSDPHPNQQRNKLRIRTHLPADRHRDVALSGGLDHVADQPQNRRIARTVQVGHVRIGPVDRQSVLDQVVGADRKEIDLPGKLVRQERGRGNLDHHTDGDVSFERNPLILEIFLDVLQDHLRLAELQERGDQREHDGDVAQRRRAKNSA